jgi:hypothetical protein
MSTPPDAPRKSGGARPSPVAWLRERLRAASAAPAIQQQESRWPQVMVLLIFALALATTLAAIAWVLLFFEVL